MGLGLGEIGAGRVSSFVGVDRSANKCVRVCTSGWEWVGVSRRQV